MACVSPSFNTVMYADGTTLCCNLSYNTNENDLNSEWLTYNKLSLNAQKTKFMFFSLYAKEKNTLNFQNMQIVGFDS